MVITEPEFLIGREDPPARRRILAEALRLFVQHGLDATGIREIAAATGFTNPALYRHFAGKEALAQHLFEQCYRELLLRLERAVGRAGGFDAKMRAFLGAFLELFDAYPEAVLYVDTHLQRFWPLVPETMRRRTVVTLLRELLRQGVAEGAPVSREREPMHVVTVIGALTQLTRLLYLGGLPGPAARWLDDLHTTLRRALQ